MIPSAHHDVVILGGGLAGLCLARQLVIDGSSRDILVLEKQRGPLAHAAKVGESMFETGSHYLADVIGLREYLESQHVRKMGLRFFFESGRPFAERPELGISDFPARFQTFQMDRGPLENHLRQLVRDSGVRLEEGADVRAARISESGGTHEVDYLAPDGTPRSVSCRWLVDATGRRRFLQRALSLERPTTSGHSSVWFYSRPWVDVSSFVPERNTAWHSRVPGGKRRLSTVQLCGDGYWVWLIGLPGDLMSIGIVVREEDHAFESIASQAGALEWIATHEPELATTLASASLSGFRTARNYSYGSARIFSHQRWACVGEAAVFADPLLANGVDLIGVANLITGKLVALDNDGELEAQAVDAINAFVLNFSGGVTHVLQHVYPYLGRAEIAGCRMLWNFLNGWVLTGPWVFDRHLLGTAMVEAASWETARIVVFNGRMDRLFEEWARLSTRRGAFPFVDYFKLPFVRETRGRHIEKSAGLDELVQKYREDVETMEQVAIAVFLLAVEDVLPEQLGRLEEHGWLNVAGIGLDPSRWETDRLFRPRSEPRDVRPIRDALRAQLRPQSPISSVQSDMV